MIKIARESKVVAASIANGAALSGVINKEDLAFGGLITPAVLSANTKIGFKVSRSEGGTYVPLYDQFNNLVEITPALNAAQAHPLPDELGPFPYFKLWSQNAGADVNQGAARAFAVCLVG